MEQVTMANTITNTDDVIDSRDIIAAVEAANEEIADLEERIAATEILPDVQLDLRRELDEKRAEHADLFKFAAEAEGAADYPYGEQFIHESYFLKHTEELISDCYEIKQSSDWPYRHMTLNLEAAADELKQDYTEYDFGGQTYYAR